MPAQRLRGAAVPGKFDCRGLHGGGRTEAEEIIPLE
jgi:hypothetical protein